MIKYQYFPQLEYHFSDYWDNHGILVVTHVVLPYSELTLADTYLGSIFDLLFNNEYSYNYYNPYFELSPIGYTIPKRIGERISCSSKTIETYLATDSVSALNVLELKDDDITMLNKLLQYRNGINPEIETVEYDDLSTVLSKLIYSYLALVVESDFTYLNTSTSISQEKNMLEILFEIYVINEAHRIIQNWSVLIDTGIVNLRPQRQKNIITSTDLQNKYVVLDSTPYNLTEFYVFKNGVLQESSYYVVKQITISGVLKTVVDWSSSLMDIDLDDILLIDYYLEVTS